MRRWVGRRVGSVGPMAVEGERGTGAGRGRFARGGGVLAVAASLGLLAAACSSGPDRTAAVGSTSTSARPTTTSSTTTSSTTTTPATTTTPPTTTTTAPPTTTTTLPGPTQLTLAFAGDLLPHLPLVSMAGTYGRTSGARYDFGPMLAPMAPVLSAADLAICHMEVPLAADQGRLSGYPSFGAPEELLDAVAAAGYDGCSTASNHSLDQGRAGIAATLDRFDALGLHHAGTARSAEEGAATTRYDVKGATVAHLSYAYGFNGYRLPADAPFAANLIDVDRIHADATRAREAGAQLVVVSLHWGTEYQHEPDRFQRDVAARLLPWPDIDVVVGHHAHVVQPIEQVAGTYVVWGLGNQLANQAQTPRSDGLTVVLHAEQQPGGRYRVVGIEAVPTYVEAGGSYRVWPIAATLRAGPVDAALRRALVASFDRTVAVVTSAQAPGVLIADRPR